MIKAHLALAGVKATSKKQVLEELSNHAAKLCGGDPADFFNALLEREKIGSTGIGRGVAIPHIKIETITEVMGIFAQLEKGVDFEAVDERPVDLIFVLLAPANSRSTQHLKALARISKFLRDESNCQALRDSATAEALAALLEQWHKSQAA